MDAQTRERYEAWKRKKLIKLAIAPALILIALLTGFILGRRSVTIPECETCPPVVVCPEPIVCEIENNGDYENGEDNPYDDPDANNGENEEENPSTPLTPPAPQWDQP